MADPHLPTTLVDWLDDLTVRFLLNLPSSELSSVPRLCFQVEEAQWYYEDFVRPAVAAAGAPPLPSLPLRQFCLLLFQHCPLFNGFSGEQHLKAYEEFLAYKVRVPVRGAILLDERMEKVVLVRGWKKGASWSFPRGKINKDEKDLHCAIREAWEETGFDIRAAGLVPDNEDDAKAIDVTMREQHMRLFVFRGVPEDTHFEPQTRKEISKIEWYAIKDLPGFKKNKGGQPQQQQGDVVSSNKFYMVAPFLGHLKKWIHEQRRQDKARAKRQSANGHGLVAGTEDEGEVEEDATPEPEAGVDLRSEQLKKLLSIGGGTPSVQPELQTQPNRLPNDSANLLAMLQGPSKPTNGNQALRTPFEQINPFPQQPESPHPHHMRQPSVPERQHFSPPRFPLSPPHSQEAAGRNFSLPTPNVFGPPQNGIPFSNQMPPGFQGMPPHMQQQRQMPPQQRQNMPPAPPPGFPFGQQNGGAGFLLQQPSRPSSQQTPQHMLPSHMQQMQFESFNSFTPPQGPEGSIGSGPSAPNPSQLPAPRQLGAEKMKLLDAFRNPASGATPPSQLPLGQAKQRPASSHQNALLDLFRKPSQTSASQVGANATPPPEQEKKEVQDPASPAGTDVTVKPVTARRTTLNEITRTLPLSKPKAKSPPPSSDMVPTQSMHSAFVQPQPPSEVPNRSHMRPEPPKERQLFDPNNPVKSTPASLAQQSKPERQLPDHKRRSREFRVQTSSTSPSRNGTTTQNGHQATPPSFTILARPGSAKGTPKSPAAPPSPLRNDSSKMAFHPQVLKRPKELDAVDAEQQPADKKDQLLALFGKSTAQTSPVPHASADHKPAAPERKPSAEDQKNRLLDLFNSSSNVSTPTAAQSPAPPRAPKIEPEQRPTSTRQQPTLSTTAHKPTQSQQQNLLLDLFSGKKTGTPTQSPGTPISPFTLGTPAVEDQAKRMGSLTGLTRSTSIGSVEGSEQSPQEQKDFLMGFLNGVVRSEGSKSSAGVGRK